MFFKGPRHPLHKDEMTDFCTKITRSITLQTGNILPAGAVCIMSAIELPPEVAASHFPKDFEASPLITP